MFTKRWNREFRLKQFIKKILTKKFKPGFVAGACKPFRWVANSFKVYTLWESLDCIPDSLLVTTEKWSPRLLAT